MHVQMSQWGGHWVRTDGKKNDWKVEWNEMEDKIVERIEEIGCFEESCK